MPPESGFAALDVRAIQLAWALLIVATPLLCWRAADAVGVAGGRALITIAVAAAVALTAIAWRGDEPLHANNHAWREAREVLIPVRGPGPGLAPFEHGRAGISLRWAVAAVERALRGTADPFRISRVGAAAAAAAAAMLALVLTSSWPAGFTTGAVVALMPMAQALAVSGSSLAIPAWLLPWSLALVAAAGRSGDRILLAGASLAAALGTLSHTAMLAWPAALVGAWLLVARKPIRTSDAALIALAVVLATWTVEAAQTVDMLADRNQGEGLLAQTQRGLLMHDLLIDPEWVSPLLLPLALLWALVRLRRARLPLQVMAGAALIIGVLPFFTVTACSSDAIRYQAPLLGLASAFAVAGVWSISERWAGGRAAVVRAAAAAALVALPLPFPRPPAEPTAVEHALVEEAARRLPPDTLVVLPEGRFAGGFIVPDFPDFLLPKGAQVVFEHDPRIEGHRGPRLAYLGLACISWKRGDESQGMRPECHALRTGAAPWLVRSLAAADLPRTGDGQPWTFHRLSLGEPFGFFALAQPEGAVGEPPRGR